MLVNNVIRSIMQAIITERDKLKARPNVLKANAQVTIDWRPLGTRIAAAPGAQPIAVLELPAQLTPSERDASQKAVSPDYLKEQGLREGTHGEIVNERGRMVFDVGFARAIRKMLGHIGPARRSGELDLEYDETIETTQHK